LADVSSRGHFLDYLLERPDVAPVWDKFVNHPFVLAMGDGTLPLESFKGYLVQDYIYLVGCLCSVSLQGSR
jgi:thiaminase